jgi:hypothetical protein
MAMIVFIAGCFSAYLHVYGRLRRVQPRLADAWWYQATAEANLNAIDASIMAPRATPYLGDSLSSLNGKNRTTL